MKQAVLYLRVSTTKKTEPGGETWLQNLDLQREPLEKLVRQRGWTLAKIYEDRMSGADHTRPGYRQLLDDARRGLFNVVVVWRFDRFARSAKHLVQALEEFQERGIDFVSYQEALDSSTAIGKAMFTIIAAMAEMERDILRERTQAGVDYAKTHGTKSGRPIGAPVKVWNRERARELQAAGWPIWRIALELDVPQTTLRRALRSTPKPPPVYGDSSG